MKKIIKVVRGRAVPKPEDNQDTDAMVYGGELNRITFKGYGKDLFANERQGNPSHPLNDPRYRGAVILLGGANYGCGSSREHAPQAHLDYGFKALVTAGYAGIFQPNCGAIGLVAVTVPKQDILELARLVKATPEMILDLNLENKILTCELGKQIIDEIGFEMPEASRQAFLDGTWDAFALLRSNPKEVEAAMKRIPYFWFN